MKGLLLRLSALDADAATAVRVIAHYEALLGGGALDPAALVRSTAGLAECAAGWEPAGGRGARVRFGPDGAPLAGAPAHVSGSADLGPDGTVWLERPGAQGPFDDLVLEWMAIAARVLGGGTGRARTPHVADPALVELAVSRREAVADRARALRLLGLAPELPLRVVAVAGGPGEDAGVAAVALLGRGAVPGTARVARVGDLGAVLLQDRAGAPSPAPALDAVLGERARERAREHPAARVGVGGACPALEAGESWAQARAALRFTGPDEPLADHDALGPVALLAEIPVERLRAQADVRALEEFAGGDGGEACLAAAAALCRTGSLRAAAAGLHLHHSSVAARVARVEAALGWRLHDPRDRFRAQLALYARRLADRPD